MIVLPAKQVGGALVADGERPNSFIRMACDGENFYFLESENDFALLPEALQASLKRHEEEVAANADAQGSLDFGDSPVRAG